MSAQRSPAARFREASGSSAFAAEEIKLHGLALLRRRGESCAGSSTRSRASSTSTASAGARSSRSSPLPTRCSAARVEAARQLGLLERYELETGPGTGGVDSHWFAERKVPAATILHFPYDEYHLPSESPALVDPRLMDDAVALAVALVESQLEQPDPALTSSS